MGIRGAKWCDFVTYTFKGMVIERIYFDPEFFASVLLKLEQFFFKHYAAYFKATTACIVLTATTTATGSISTCLIIGRLNF